MIIPCHVLHGLSEFNSARVDTLTAKRCHTIWILTHYNAKHNTTYIHHIQATAETKRFSQQELCCHSLHRRLSKHQPLVQPVLTKLSSWIPFSSSYSQLVTKCCWTKAGWVLWWQLLQNICRSTCMMISWNAFCRTGPLWGDSTVTPSFVRGVPHYPVMSPHQQSVMRSFNIFLCF